MLTTEELLRPRFKVIADYPGCPFEVGQVAQMNRYGPPYMPLIVDGKEVKIMEWSGDVDTKNGSFGLFSERVFTGYPHLFQQLEWWEERKPEDMPGYVKDPEGIIDSQNNPMESRVFKVKKHFSTKSGDWRDDTYRVFAPEDSRFISLNYSEYLPATEAEYLTYKNKNHG